jgi:hypothetical protein
MNSPMRRLQHAMLDLPQVEFKTQHYFFGGMYIREVFFPKGALIVGHVHKTEHVFMLTKGRMQVATENGSVMELVAPFSAISPPSVKRAGLALEDTICVTVHITDLIDIAEIERTILEPDPECQFLPGNRLPRLEVK